MIARKVKDKVCQHSRVSIQDSGVHIMTGPHWLYQGERELPYRASEERWCQSRVIRIVTLDKSGKRIAAVMVNSDWEGRNP